MVGKVDVTAQDRAELLLSGDDLLLVSQVWGDGDLPADGPVVDIAPIPGGGTGRPC
ncbi:MAG: hypothetical protein R2695_11010 [Acidimicrobiales bacterium]